MTEIMTPSNAKAVIKNRLNKPVLVHRADIADILTGFLMGPRTQSEYTLLVRVCASLGLEVKHEQ